MTDEQIRLARLAVTGQHTTNGMRMIAWLTAALDEIERLAEAKSYGEKVIAQVVAERDAALATVEAMRLTLASVTQERNELSNDHDEIHQVLVDADINHYEDDIVDGVRKLSRQTETVRKLHRGASADARAMRPVVEAAIEWRHSPIARAARFTDPREEALDAAVDTYRGGGAK